MARRFYWLWGGLALAAASIPYLSGWLATPPGQVFAGALLNPDDMGVYVSAMRQGAAGHWLYHFTYSPEPWQPRLMLLLYLVLGKLTALWATPTIFWLHLWRLVLGGVALVALYHWLVVVLPRPQWRRTAWLLLLFGGGFGWLAALLVPTAARPPDLGLAEWLPLLALFNTPHFALGLGLEAAVFAGIFRLTQSDPPRWPHTLLTASLALLAGLIYVYHLAIIGLVAGLALLLLAAKRRRLPWRHWGHNAVILLPLAALLLYYLLAGDGDPYWQQYTRVDHIIPPPAPLVALIGLGGVGLLALAGGRWWLQHGQPLLVPLWAVANLLALYLPGIPFSGRFALGLWVPVATLAAVGLEEVIAPIFTATNDPARPRRLLLLLLTPSTLIALALFTIAPRQQPGFPYYLPTADVAAATWLGQHSNASALTLADYPLGNYLPRVYDGKVFMGQLDFTTDLEEKLALADWFWHPDTTLAQRRAFVAQWGITHIFIGQYEQQRPADLPLPGQIVYDQDGTRILAITP